LLEVAFLGEGHSMQTAVLRSGATAEHHRRRNILIVSAPKKEWTRPNLMLPGTPQGVAGGLTAANEATVGNQAGNYDPANYDPSGALAG
jgi:hypothetical protein